jgi:hypothetical protein
MKQNRKMLAWLKIRTFLRAHFELISRIQNGLAVCPPRAPKGDPILSSDSDLKMGSLLVSAIVGTIAVPKSEPILSSDSELKMGSPFGAQECKQRAHLGFRI